MPWLYDEAYTLGRTSARTGDLVQGGVDFNGLEGVGVVFEPFRPEEISNKRGLSSFLFIYSLLYTAGRGPENSAA